MGRTEPHDAMRLIRAARAAGCRVTGVKLRGGEITVLIADGAPGKPHAPKINSDNDKDNDDEVENWIRKNVHPR
jgi:hypothetical protein